MPTAFPLIDTEVIPEYSTCAPSPSQTFAVDGKIILLRWIYIKDRNKRYLTECSGPQEYTLTFQSGDPDLDCAFEVVRATFPTLYRIYARSGTNMMRYNHENGWYSSNDSVINHFHFITLRDNKVYIKDNIGPLGFLSNELNSSQSPVAHDFINESSEMQIIQASIRAKNEIVDVHYDINGAKVRSVAPIISLSTGVRNEGEGMLSQQLRYSYEKWKVGTWNNTAGIEIGEKGSFKAGVPFIVDANFEVSVSVAYSHECGGETGTKETVDSTTIVSIPPRKKGTAKVIIRNAQLDVGFTYTEKTLWANGKEEIVKKTGIYTNVDSWHVDVELSDLEPV